MGTDRKNGTFFVRPNESETALLILLNFIHLKKSSWFGSVKVFASMKTRVTISVFIIQSFRDGTYP